MKTNILIADDEPNQLELMSYNLETSGFGTIKARDGKNALQLIEDHSPDLVILDWMMPNMSGIDLCRTLRSRSETKQLPIIILSARSDDSDKSLGLDTGADDYISKPFSPKELISRVNALLRRSRPALINNILEHENLKGPPFYVLAFVQLVFDSIRFFTESNNDIRQCLFNSEPKVKTWNIKLENPSQLLVVVNLCRQY